MQIPLDQLISPNFYDVHHEIKENLYDEYWLRGGRGSTKSTFISIQIILGMLKDPDANAVVTRRYQTLLRNTVYGQFIWTIRKMGLEEQFRFFVSPMQIKYIPTGQIIAFMGADDPTKIKSINLGHGYIKYSWFEEVSEFAGMDELRNIIQSLFRGAETGHRVSFYSFNPPRTARAWVNSETRIPKPGRRVHESNYQDVPPEWLGDIFIKNAQHLRNTNDSAYRHEYLGEEVGTGLEVFNNITIAPITDLEISGFDQIRQGVDWGYAIDPLAFIRMHYDRKRRSLYLFQEISGIGLLNKEFSERAKPFFRMLTIADSSEPKSIAEMQSYGMKIVGAKKGAGSVESGIKFLQGMEKIIIDPSRCPRAAKEFINYSLETTRAGEVKSNFPDKDNHILDAVRYACEDDMPKPNQSPIIHFVPSIAVPGVRI